MLWNWSTLRSCSLREHKKRKWKCHCAALCYCLEPPPDVQLQATLPRVCVHFNTSKVTNKTVTKNQQSMKAHMSSSSLCYLLKTSLGMRICCNSAPQTFSCSIVSADIIIYFSTSTGGAPYKSHPTITSLTTSQQLCQNRLSASQVASCPILTQHILTDVSSQTVKITHLNLSLCQLIQFRQ